jgi:hypothetical protein
MGELADNTVIACVMVGVGVCLVGEQRCLPENEQQCGQPTYQTFLHDGIVVRRSWSSIAEAIYCS